MITWNPPVDGVCVSINFISYDDHIKMAVMTDPMVLPNPELITKHFAHQVCSQWICNSMLCSHFKKFLTYCSVYLICK
jgi:hypothetical protein